MTKPAGVAVGPDGNAYVADASQHITVISPAGKVLRRWGGHGQGPGQFNFIKHDNAPDVPGVSSCVAVGKDGTVYVCDTGNARVQVFSATGKFIRAFGHYGRGPNDWLLPSDLALDSDGSLYVADDWGQSLWRFDKSGAKDWTMLAANQTDEDLSGHQHLAGVDDHHRLVFAVDENSHIVSIDARGHKVDSYSVGDGADQTCGSSLGPDANVYLTSCAEPLDTPHDLTVVNRAHQTIGVWSPAPVGWPPHFGPKGEIFTVRDSDGALLRLTSNMAGR
jgi:DNA-binding beta-propeller fold protein YncE